MSFSSTSRPNDAPPKLATTWQDDVRAGRLNEALANALATTPNDEAAVQLINDLMSLRGYFRAKDWGKAERLARTLALAMTSIAPTFEAEVILLKGSGERLERGDADGALAQLKGAKLPLFLAEAETQRGTALVFLGEADDAAAAFRRATEADPKHYRAITNLGNVALEAGREDEAIALYGEALKANENFANAHHNLGVAYRRKGQVHKSVQAIRKAQRVGRQRDRNDAKESMRGLVSGRGGRYVKWLLWAAGAIALYFILQALNIL